MTIWKKTPSLANTLESLVSIVVICLIDDLTEKPDSSRNLNGLFLDSKLMSRITPSYCKF